MVLLSNKDSTDRAMISVVRPPDVVDERTLREFSRRSRGDEWWALPAETTVGEVGQANLLQAQVRSSVRRVDDETLTCRCMTNVYRIMCFISRLPISSSGSLGLL